MAIQLQGRIDSNNAAQVEKEIAAQLAGQSGAPVELDATGLEYISSAGLRVLLAAQKEMNKKGVMKLTHVSETIMEIFEVTGFSDILTIE
jgi:anti-sigma B factor antagonist